MAADRHIEVWKSEARATVGGVAGSFVNSPYRIRAHLLLAIAEDASALSRGWEGDCLSTANHLAPSECAEVAGMLKSLAEAMGNRAGEKNEQDCTWCVQGFPLYPLDEDGVYTASAATLYHADGDEFWLCDNKWQQDTGHD